MKLWDWAVYATLTLIIATEYSESHPVAYAVVQIGLLMAFSRKYLGEPKTERVHLYTDDTETQQFFLGGHKFYELTIDKMIRHKWPEEKPEKPAKYLVRVEYDDNVAIVTTDEWNGIDWYAHIEGYITHWWNLPEVTE